MKFNLKNVFLSVGIFAFTLALVGIFSANTALANTCTFDGSTDNDWNDNTNWSNCGGVIPTSADDVIIPTALTVTVDTAAVAASLLFQDAVDAANGVTISGSNSLTVTGATTLSATTGTAGATIAVGAGTFSTATLVITDGAAGGAHTLSVAAGSATVTGNISGTWTDPADVIFLSTGAGNMYFGGNFPSGGTLTTTSTGTITFNGTGDKTIGAYLTYNNLVINKPGGSMTMSGAVRALGNFTLTAGTLATAGIDFTVDLVSDITGTLTTTAGGTKTFTGNVTLNSGAVWSETGSSAFVFGGNFVNNATTFTSSTGSHTFNGATTKAISGATTTGSATTPITISVGNHTNSGVISASVLTITGVTLTNTGTVTAATQLTGAGGTFTNTTGTLNIGDAIDTLTLDATNNANTINYTKAGAQTLLAAVTNYGNLGLSGSGAKTIPAVTVIDGTLTITDSGTDTTATLSGIGNTAYKLYFGTAYQKRGTWGSTTETDATHKNDTYFTPGVDALITVSLGSTSGGNNEEETTYTYTPTTTTTTSSITVTPEITVTPVVTPTPTTPQTLCPNGKTAASNCTLAPTPANPNGYAFGLTLVKKGTKGEACSAWQNFFNDKTGANLVVDGNCGKLTIAAAKAWQKSMGLSADGLLGAKSRAKATQ